jgi:hypothetical protein
MADRRKAELQQGELSDCVEAMFVAIVKPQVLVSR